MSYGYFGRARTVPFNLPLQLLFGRVFFLVGFIFSVVALLFLFVLGSNAKPNPFNDASPTVDGVITDIRRTNSSINEERVYQFFYTFNIGGISEKTGSSYSQQVDLQIGDTVRVLHENKDPFNSVIVGMRTGEIEPWIILFLLPVLLIGLVFVGISVRNARRDILLLKYGKVALGKLLTKERSNVTINNQPVYNIYFQFNADDGKTYTSICKTHLPYWVEDEEEEKLVYDPRDPSTALLIDSLPRKLRTFFKDAK
ncbi:MAG: DUF3592 domain-containing protein [Salinivirgaceae bacterium]|nr:DUF3592 domain-containing protein [Salinivirgaceae bacterium]